MKKVGILLLSDQTIPNLQFIKEKSKEIDAYLLVTTLEMQKKKVKEHLLQAAKMSEDQILGEVLVDPHRLEKISEELEKVLSDGVEYHLNITGGTKMMAIAAYDILKQKGADIYYITYRRELMKVFPKEEVTSRQLTTSITLPEFLQAYGHDVKRDATPDVPESLVYDFFHFFLKNGVPACLSIFFERRNKKKKKNKKIELTPEMKNCLDSVTGFFSEKTEITSSDLRAITGEWLEQWVFDKVKEELRLDETKIGKGIYIERGGTKNELDVVFVYEDKLYVIECKSSLFTMVAHKTEPKDKKGQNLITPTIYKSDSLRSEFGLQPRTFILTMDDLELFSEEAKKRAKNKHIKLIGKQELQEVASGGLLTTHLGIKKS